MTAPATTVAASIKIIGLKVSAVNAAVTVSVEAKVGSHDDSSKALNVLDFDGRLGGQDRYETAAAIFNTAFGKNGAAPSTSVVLSGGQLFPDALSANYLAGQVGQTGTLLTRSDKLPPATRNAILDNDIDTVYITGGTTAISNRVQNKIEAMHVGGEPGNKTIRVIRRGGQDRYATNKTVNEYHFASQSPDTVLLASGNGFADALTLGPIAYRQQYPLILTNGSSLDGTTAQAQLNDYQPKNVVIAGGADVVSQGIEDQLKADGYHVTRLAGSNRTYTAAAVDTWATTDQGFKASRVGVTNGQFYADALSAGPATGLEGSVFVLAHDRDTLGGGASTYLGTKVVSNTNDGKSVGTLGALGLTAATTNSLMRDAAAAIDTQ